jgi:chorismate dehydratase
MWDFEHGDAGSTFEISYTVPSGCAVALRDGSADIGIIPAAAYATIPELVILPEMAIAARGPVQSILLVSKFPLENVRTVATDSSSLTSVALTKVLFAKWWGADKAFRSAAPDLEHMLEHHDAALLIGDSALKIDRTRYLTYDLAEEWVRLTNKPFVFAFWAVRKAALKDCVPNLDLGSVFKRSRDHGLLEGNVERIAQEWSTRVGLSESEVKSYLTESIHYHLDAECIEGLYRFYRYAWECGILPSPLPLQFLESPKSAFVR